MGRVGRPERTGPPELFYNEDEARKYTTNSRIIEVQASLAERALELLNLRADGVPRMLLDLGCGSGLSGEVLSDAGHLWVGLDISTAMLDVALERGVDGDLIVGDMGTPLPFLPGTIDGAISISAVQWLCNADSAGADPFRRMRNFFGALYACLARGGRAALQLYPENAAQAEMLTAAAMRAGFSGGMVVDYPHSTRAKKHFLVLMVGGGEVPRGMGEDRMEVEGEVPVGGRRGGRGAKGKGARDREWVMKMKGRMRARGREGVPEDSRYTGRKRKVRF